MIKTVWSDWVLQRRDGAERIKQNYKNGFAPVNFLCLGCYWSAMYGMNTHWKDGVLLALENILLYFLFTIHAMYPNCMSKAMLLTPMDAREKKQYVKTWYWMKVGIFLFVQIVLMGIAIGSGHLPTENGILIMLSFFILSLMTGLDSQKKEERTGISLLFVNILCLFAIEGSFLGEQSVLDGTAVTAGTIILVILQCFLAICYIKKRWKAFFDEVTKYQPIEEKVKK